MTRKPGSPAFVVYYLMLGTALGIGVAVIFDNLQSVTAWLKSAAATLQMNSIRSFGADR